MIDIEELRPGFEKWIKRIWSHKVLKREGGALFYEEGWVTQRFLGWIAAKCDSAKGGVMEIPKKGSWVFDGCKQIGRVVHDPYECFGIAHIDIAIYSRAGIRLGRTSPRCGGPSSFEPACPSSYWSVIERPLFPLSRYEYLKNLVRSISRKPDPAKEA